ncbi:hypothetical protein MKW94_013956 [Papaver nudicaule]|uniref:Uncharacterized protein n=1 Tax=Papaver nudicaule TaxID=74823 RepID=A0AA41RQS5_PAPNU|nr:hypothetical protein [Papaver nudicaule]
MCSSNTKVSISSPSSAVYDQDEGDHEITSSTDYGFREDLVNDGVVGTYMSRLSIEGSDNDGDEEFSDEEGGNKGRRRRRMTISSAFSSDSDKENGCVSLPATSNRRRSRRSTGLAAGLKDYASENELQPEKGNKMKSKNSTRRIVRERWVEKCWDYRKPRIIRAQTVKSANPRMSNPRIMGADTDGISNPHHLTVWTRVTPNPQPSIRSPPIRNILKVSLFRVKIIGTIFSFENVNF